MRGVSSKIVPLYLVPALVWLLGGAAVGQSLLEGEFGDIDLGRRLIDPERFPTIQELRAAVKQEEIRPVVLFTLYADENNQHLPAWSYDGRRLAFQRTKVGAASSKILWFAALSDERPALLSGHPDTYDYHFRWGVNSQGSFVFTRLGSAQGPGRVFYTLAGGEPQAATAPSGRYYFPALYERTDGIRRLLYEQDGNLVHEALSDQGSIERPLVLARGTGPRWSRDGYHVLYGRERSRGSAIASFDLAVRNLQTGEDLVLPSPKSGTLRGWTWSPDEQFVAWYAREPGNNQPWRIEVCRLAGDAPPRTLGSDVVVNQVFDSGAPSFEPSSRRVWFFSHAQRQQAYYPLIAADVESGATRQVDYARRCTTPTDLALNPAAYVPELSFVGHTARTQDLLVLFLNHY